AAKLVGKQTAYRQKIQNCTQSLLDNFLAVVNAAQISTKEEDDVGENTQIAKEQYEVEIKTHNIVRAAETLICIISELKEKYLFSDFDTLNKNVENANTAYDDCRNESEDALADLQREIAAHLDAIETSFYTARLT
ncbi:hypothetical protein SARC_11994, partial [Sphaeroforma arctica JP610]